MSMLATVAEPRRREILRLVWSRERAAGDIASHLDVTFGAVSQHLRILRESGLVLLRKEGRHRFYRADRRALGPLARALEAEWARSLARRGARAESEQGGRDE
jgi:DNA-binding transcriptional ArsR family regulator